MHRLYMYKLIFVCVFVPKQMDLHIYYLHKKNSSYKVFTVEDNLHEISTPFFYIFCLK